MRWLTLIPSYARFLKWRLILHNDLVKAGMEADRKAREAL